MIFNSFFRENRNYRQRLQKPLSTLRLITLLLFIFCIKVNAGTYSQTITFNGKGPVLRALFSAIEKQTNYVVIYKKELINKAGSISINVRNTPLTEVLDLALQKQPLKYTIENTTIFITEKEIPVFSQQLGTNNILAEVIDLTGVVKDEKGEPLKGVNISIKGTARGTETNENGVFSLTNIPKNTILEISIAGYKTQQYKVGEETNISIVLVQEVQTMEDVVVTGFQRIDRKKFTGAAVSLRTEDIKIDGITDVSRMLQGRAAGVSVQNVSGTFGAAPKIRIRGATSISGNNKPLWVIDGVVLEDIIDISNEQLSSGDVSTLLGSSVAGLNVNDIESFDILKDASATAMYGARAMNGVVVITTKKGKVATAPTINYNLTLGYQLKPSYSSFDIMNSSDMVSVYAEALRKGYIQLSDLPNANSSGIFGKVAQLIQHPDENGNFVVQNTPESIERWLLAQAGQNTNWFDELFRNSLVQTHSLSFTGGNEKVKTYFSGSYMNDPGWTISDKVQRITAKFDNVYNLSSKLTAGFGVLASARDQRTAGSEERKSDPARGIFSREFDLNPFSYALNTSRVLPAHEQDGSLAYFTRNYAPFNIKNELDNNYNKLKNIDITLRANVNYKLLKNLTYDFIGSVRYVKNTTEHNVLENSNQAEAYRANPNSIVNRANPYLYEDPSNPGFPKIVVLPYGGFYKRNDLDLTNYTFRNSLSYKAKIGDDHQLDLFAGQELRYLNRNSFNNLGVGYQYGNGGIPYNYYYFFKQLNEVDSSYYSLQNFRDRAVAFFGSATYTYKNKYVLQLTGRTDGTNQLLASSTRWTPTWTVAGVWNLDQEDFIRNIEPISRLSYQVSYGLNASSGSATNSTAILRSKTTPRINVTDQQPSIYIDQLENGKLGLEKAYTFSTGLDIGLFKNRLGVNIQYYDRKSFDLIGAVKTAGIGGQIVQSANYASLKSRGVDLMIDGKIIQTKDFSYNAMITMGWNVSKITTLRTAPTISDLTGESGGAFLNHPVRGLYSLRNAGLDPYNGTPVYLNEKGQVSSAVNLLSINTSNLIYEGPIDPKISGGFNNVFRYKDLTLTIFVTYQAGNKIRLTPIYQEGYGDLASLPNEFRRRWTLPGDDTRTNIPSIAGYFTNYSGSYGIANLPAYPYDNYNYSHDRVADGGFIRLQAATLSYKLRSNILSKANIKAASFSVTGNNLWLIYSDSRLHGQDPEFFNTGGVALPVNKQITASLNITF
jgi:TonB-linked SusC/RagA family outer membrane protein